MGNENSRAAKTAPPRGELTLLTAVKNIEVCTEYNLPKKDGLIITQTL